MYKRQKYDATIKIDVFYDNAEMKIEGVVENNEAKIISIDDYDVRLTLEGKMAIIKYVDLPGTIGKIGKILGDYKINIAEMQVGRQTEGGEAIMVLKVDQEITEEVVSKLEDDNDIDFVKPVKL